MYKFFSQLWEKIDDINDTFPIKVFLIIFWILGNFFLILSLMLGMDFFEVSTDEVGWLSGVVGCVISIGVGIIGDLFLLTVFIEEKISYPMRQKKYYNSPEQVEKRRLEEIEKREQEEYKRKQDLIENAAVEFDKIRAKFLLIPDDISDFDSTITENDSYLMECYKITVRERNNLIAKYNDYVTEVSRILNDSTTTNIFDKVEKIKSDYSKLQYNYDMAIALLEQIKDIEVFNFDDYGFEEDEIKAKLLKEAINCFISKELYRYSYSNELRDKHNPNVHYADSMKILSDAKIIPIIEKFKSKVPPVIIAIEHRIYCIYNKTIIVFNMDGKYIESYTVTKDTFLINRRQHTISIKTGEFYYLHTCIDGTPDLRYSHNPLIERIKNYEIKAEIVLNFKNENYLLYLQENEELERFQRLYDAYN